MKRNILLNVVMLLAFIGVQAQTSVVEFGYDDAGNRVLRQIKIDKVERSDQTPFSDSLYAPLPDQHLEGVRVYPNPASETVNIVFTTLPEDEKAEFVLSDMHGRLLEQNSILHTLTLLSIKHLGKGTYLLLIKAGAKNEKFKIVKQ